MCIYGFSGHERAIAQISELGDGNELVLYLELQLLVLFVIVRVENIFIHERKGNFSTEHTRLY